VPESVPLDRPRGGSLVCLTNPSSPQGLQIRNFNDILFTATSANTGSPLGNQLTAVSGRYLGFYQPLLTSFVDGAQMVADRSFQALANLGPLPSVDVIETLNVDLRYLIPFRNGWSLQPLVSFQGIKDNYEGKSDITSRGGEGGLPSYQAIFGLALVAAPLEELLRDGRRRGGAGRPAEPGGRDRGARQAGSQAVRDTVLAYWDLAAAEERVKLLERSARNQRQIGELSESLVKADEIPASEMNRIRARTADADGRWHRRSRRSPRRGSRSPFPWGSPWPTSTTLPSRPIRFPRRRASPPSQRSRLRISPKRP